MTRNIAINISKKNSLRAHEDLSAITEMKSEDMHSDESTVLQEAIARLPEDLTKDLILFYYKGYTTSEIAEMHNITRDAVCKRINTAKELLRKILAEGDRK